MTIRVQRQEARNRDRVRTERERVKEVKRNLIEAGEETDKIDKERERERELENGFVNQVPKMAARYCIESL